MFRCEYAGKTKGPRYEMWREQWARHWLSADFEPIGGDGIVNEITATEHSFLGLCNMRSTPVRIDRRYDLNYNAPGTRYLVIASGSLLHTRQRGTSIDLSPGQMILLNAEEPAQVAQVTEGDRWSIRIPQNILDQVCRGVEGKIARPIDAAGELQKLLLRQVDTVHRFGPNLDAAANHMMAQHIFDLVVLCLGADRDAAQLAKRRGLAAARLDAIKTDILRRLGRSDAGLASVAASHGLSTRYVQHLFELAGTSFTSFVLEQRLLLAHRLLCEPQNRWRKISDIAAAAGFSDISYFNRAFKARFGAAPSGVRSNPTAGP